MRFAGKIVVVTGSSRGIGKAIALAMAQEGATVVVTARTEQERRLPGTIHATVAEIEAAGGRALPVRCDVRDEASVDELIRRVVTDFGRIDVFVNNAARASYIPFLELSVAEWDAVLTTSLRGPFLCCRAVAPIMVQQRAGTIVNISSHAADNVFSTAMARDPEKGRTVIGQAYGAAKAGLDRLTRGLAAELAPYNIAVNAVKPAHPVLTEGFALQRSDADTSGWVPPDAMVKATLFLAAQDAAGVTGLVARDADLIEQYNL